jgi:TonB family protein
LVQTPRISTGFGVDVSAGPQIERILEQVLEQVLLATSAISAAIALKTGTGDEMVCRATAGPNTPDIGVRLDVGSGLSGACVRTREIQYCADTQSDPRANAAASRRLQVRSVLVVPLMGGNKLLGVVEIFSPHLGAFGNRDLENLQTLSQVIVENLLDPGEHLPPATMASNGSPPTADVPAVVEIAVPEPPSPLPAELFGPPSQSVLEGRTPREETLPAWPTTQTPKEETPSQKIAHAASIASQVDSWSTKAEAPVFSASFPAKRTRQKRSREWGTTLLTAAVITVAVVFGWTVGRPGWQKTTGRRTKPAVVPTSGSGSADLGKSRNNAPATNSANSDNGKAADDSVKAAEMRTSDVRTSKDQPDKTSGDLLVSRNGKVIFQQTTRTPLRSDPAELKTPQPDPEAPEKGATVFLSPQMAGARLIQRVEPVYPDRALQLRIQGQVELEALVGKDGSIEQLKLVSGDELLAAAAADAVRQWHFKPYESDGQAVEFSTRLNVDFRLH